MSFLSFAGCTSDAPVVRPEAACSPATATINWDAGSRADDALIGVYRLTYSTDVQDWVSTYSPITASPAFADDAITTITGGSRTARAEWELALLVDARRTGQVGQTYGLLPTVDDPTAPTIKPDGPNSGTFVVAVNVNQFTMPFTIHCNSGRKVIGSVTAPLTGGFASALYECGDARDRGQPALDYCNK
jgi:hypothetical protein